MKEAGTSYHVHFDVQVPTKVGWVFVNPYMTLVAAYERLIGERGSELADATVVATADPASTGSISTTARIEPDKPRAKKAVKHAHIKAKVRRRQHIARQ
jgi:hypothetical protein